MAVPRGAVVKPDGFVYQTGKLLGNTFLTDITYKHTIKDMVSRHFKDAVYLMSDVSWISDIPDIDKGGTLVIQGQKGFGKSKAIRMLKDKYFSGKSIVHINFSRSLAYFSAKNRGPDVHHYAEDDLPLTADLLEVVINSLPRVKRPYDVVVIDEVVSVISNISGALITDTHRMAVLNSLKNLLQAAKYVIIADAMIEPITVAFVRILRGAWSPLRIIDYTHRPQAGHTCIAYGSQDKWKNQLKCQLKAGKKVVVASMMAWMVKVLKRELGSEFPELSIQVYFDGEGSNDTAKAMKNIKVWKKCDLLIYSPVITAGCSFEERHFDTLFFLGISSPYAGNVQSAIQMTSRVRDLKDRTIHAFIRDEHYGAPPPSTVTLPSCHPSYPMSVLDASVKCIQLFREHSWKSKLSGFAYEFYQHKVNAGFDLVYPSGVTLEDSKRFLKNIPTPPPIPKDLSLKDNDLLQHLTMSDIEHKLNSDNVFTLVDVHVLENEKLDYTDLYFEFRDHLLFELWCFYAISRFIRHYWKSDPLKEEHVSWLSLGRFEKPEVKEDFQDLLVKFNKVDVPSAAINYDLAWRLANAHRRYIDGRPIAGYMSSIRFPKARKRLASQMVRQSALVIIKQLKARDATISFNLPCVTGPESFLLQGQTVIEEDGGKTLVLLTQEEPGSHQLKNDFLRLHCQAALLAYRGSITIECLQVVHTLTCRSWSMPFMALTEEYGAIVDMVSSKETVIIREKIIYIEVEYDHGSLQATIHYADRDPIPLFGFTPVRSWILSKEWNDFYVIGFGFWYSLEEAFYDEPEVLELIKHMFDIQFMIQAVSKTEGMDIEDFIDNPDAVMGLGYHTNVTSSFVDAFIDIKQSKGFTYVFPKGGILSIKCGDVLCIGDCHLFLPIE